MIDGRFHGFDLFVSYSGVYKNYGTEEINALKLAFLESRIDVGLVFCVRFFLEFFFGQGGTVRLSGSKLKR